MEQFNNKILFFADLDDSFFQTRKKDIKGKFKATFPKNILKTSYYTKHQYNFLKFILKNEEIVFIPLTARTKDQFERTKIYKKKQAQIYSSYYGSCLFINGQEHLNYTKSISKNALICLNHLEQLVNSVVNKYPEVEFNNVDSKYYTTDSKDQKVVDYLIYLINQQNLEIDIYIEEKYITLLPKICNKSSIVKYLQNRLKPTLTIGIGNSTSDLDFLNLCNFKIISHIGILHGKLNS
jgi:hypothetical protein